MVPNGAHMQPHAVTFSPTMPDGAKSIPGWSEDDTKWNHFDARRCDNTVDVMPHDVKITPKWTQHDAEWGQYGAKLFEHGAKTVPNYAEMDPE